MTQPVEWIRWYGSGDARRGFTAADISGCQINSRVLNFSIPCCPSPPIHQLTKLHNHSTIVASFWITQFSLNDKQLNWEFQDPEREPTFDNCFVPAFAYGLKAYATWDFPWCMETTQNRTAPKHWFHAQIWQLRSRREASLWSKFRIMLGKLIHETKKKMKKNFFMAQQ